MKTITSIKNQKFKFILFIVALLSAQCFAQKGEKKEAPTAIWGPVPAVIEPGTCGSAPSDALILFDGTNTDEWESTKGGKVKWKLEDGAMTVVKKTGSIKTKKAFGSCQLHIEWRTPKIVVGKSQDRGNSGIFLQGRYEVQVLDSYNNKTYVNGQAGSIYKQYIPLVNACRPPGVWQSYDIIYSAPEFNKDNTLAKPAFITVLQNGVLIQNHVEIKGNTVHQGEPHYEKHNAKEPIILQDHGCPVSYRNIWIREL